MLSGHHTTRRSLAIGRVARLDRDKHVGQGRHVDEVLEPALALSRLLGPARLERPAGSGSRARRVGTATRERGCSLQPHRRSPHVALETGVMPIVELMRNPAGPAGGREGGHAVTCAAMPSAARGGNEIRGAGARSPASRHGCRCRSRRRSGSNSAHPATVSLLNKRRLRKSRCTARALAWPVTSFGCQWGPVVVTEEVTMFTVGDAGRGWQRVPPPSVW